MNDELRTCTRCEQDKPLHEFSLRSTITKVRHRICKECHKIVAREYYLTNKEKSFEQVKSWQAKNKEKRKSIARKSAKKRQRNNKQLAVD